MISGSMVALVTPMHEDGRVDFDRLRELVDWHVESGTDALVIAGTTGESATLEKPEHIQVIETSVSHAAGRIPVFAGTGSNATKQTIELSQAVDALDIDGFLVVTPYYNKPTQNGLIRHFSAVADAVSRPLMLYNVPGRTAVDMLPETIAELSRHPNIFAVKEATGDVARVGRLRELCAEDFRLYSGDDATAREFMLAGGHGVVSVTANAAPAAMAEMCAAALANDVSRAAELDSRMEALHRDLFVEANPIPIKWVLERMGRIGNGIRLPLTWLEASHEAIVAAAMQRAGLT